ncbi:MAG: glycosyltransferase [Ruminococcaceae bacterium]|nr:glycosyltransferase [Oscillospiraceae bacterium]
MKRILIIHSNMELGGAETSLLGLLYAMKTKKCEVDLMLMQHSGELMQLLPEHVNLLPENKAYRAMMLPIKTALLGGEFGVAAARLTAKAVCAVRTKRFCFTDKGYIVKQRSHYYATNVLPKIEGEYDLAISFNDPHYILAKKVKARRRVGWFHTDFLRIVSDPQLEDGMWRECDAIVNVSDECKRAFDASHPTLVARSIVIENILAKEFVHHRAQEDVSAEMPCDGSIRLLSVGRYTNAKNFDNVPYICRRLRQMGLHVKWYLIGFGGDEELIRRSIAEAGMEEHVIMLGKKANPYPYIAACDLYVQPSRYEGKAVTVREAQMLGKPVVITRYATSASQLEENVDGVIVPMDNEGCAAGIAALLRDEAKMERLRQTCLARDYSNAEEVEKIYQLME